MLTPKEVSEHGFQRASLGGYSMAMVDDFLDTLTEDYTALYRENIALKKKLKALTVQTDQYRATEDAMKSTLAVAQEMACAIVSEAEERRESILADAEMEARALIGALNSEIDRTQDRLDAARAETMRFIEKVQTVCSGEVEAPETLPDLSPDSAAPAFAEPPAGRDTAASTATPDGKLTTPYDLRSKERELRIAEMMSKLDDLQFAR